ncbi:hypothetical protein [uncultured Dubosiella sp.]|uniref:hypothetical protein n=1 Tax=uncultured Dubosiella sp. TaxID=1937011 RepID=UPI0025875A1B|nr:hypothetical protein [uncultured Dubosiella sp.]
MSEVEKTIDVYYDMDIAQICQHFNKSRNTVDKAIAKLVKDNPDKDWKYKNPETKRITIKAEGVEKLSTYFRKEKHEVSAVEMELRYENEKLKAIIEEKEKAANQIEQLYKERLLLELEKNRQTFLLENQTKESKISELESENQKLKKELSEAEELKRKNEDYKRKEEEYNSKSFFYRLMHKI